MGSEMYIGDSHSGDEILNRIANGRRTETKSGSDNVSNVGQKLATGGARLFPKEFPKCLLRLPNFDRM